MRLHFLIFLEPPRIVPLAVKQAQSQKPVEDTSNYCTNQSSSPAAGLCYCPGLFSCQASCPAASLSFVSWTTCWGHAVASDCAHKDLRGRGILASGLVKGRPTNFTHSCQSSYYRSTLLWLFLPLRMRVPPTSSTNRKSPPSVVICSFSPNCSCHTSPCHPEQKIMEASILFLNLGQLEAESSIHVIYRERGQPKSHSLRVTADKALQMDSVISLHCSWPAGFNSYLLCRQPTVPQGCPRPRLYETHPSCPLSSEERGILGAS